MTDLITELAHWRYRVKALLRDVVKTAKTEAEWSTHMGMFPADYIQETTGRLRAQLKLEEWLLEEARYRVELVELQILGDSLETNPPVAQPLSSVE